MTHREIIVNRKLYELTERMQHGSNANIFYIVSEERNFQNFLFSCANFKKVISLLVGPTCYNNNFLNVTLPNLPSCIQKRKQIADAQAVFDDLKITDISAGRVTAETIKKNLGFFPHIFLLRDFHTLTNSSRSTELLKKFLAFAEQENSEKMLLLILSPNLDIPLGFEQEMIVLDAPALGETEIAEAITERYDYSQEAADKVRVTASEFKGLDLPVIYDIQDQVYARYHTYFGTEADEYRKKKINEAKEAKAKQDSTITFIPPQDSVAGMENLNKWSKRNIWNYVHAEEARRNGIERPNGILLCGLPGTGKTQMAKKMSYDMTKENGWISVPLIQFRMDNILGGLVGDSEKNFKRCRKKIEDLAPCIVLFDEIEKTFSNEEGSQKADHKMNILTALLDWLQENDKVFFYATCNGTRVPPELLREGRFDMKFSVFLPPQEELESIMKYHLKRFNSSDYANGFLFRKDFNMDKLVKVFFDRITELSGEKGDQQNRFYTGANIESLIKKTNVRLSHLVKDRNTPNYSNEEYLEALLDTAMSSESQPYGMTNMDEIVSYWFMAMKNQYMEASETNLFAFSDFDQENGTFKKQDAEQQKQDAEQQLSHYDSWMQETVRAKIEEEAKRRKDSLNK